MIVVHVTHEAVEKIGGIGAVVAGLMTTDAYQETVSRTVLLGPLLQTDRPVNRRLGPGGQVLYSSLDGVSGPPWAERFRPIERTYDAGIIYGRRKVVEPCMGKQCDAETLLLDVFHANQDRLNLFKAELYKKFAVPSQQFECIWEYEQYVRLAEPGYEALQALGIDAEDEQVVFLAHEYMGMPTALKAVLSGLRNVRTVFYAHEVASVRPIVEESPGHDTMFYNVLDRSAGDGVTLEKVFPGALQSFKHSLVKAGRYCDHVFAVGDFIEKELRFLDPRFSRLDVDLVYNGIPARPLTVERREQSKGRMQQYAKNLFGFRPEWVFTHVARPVRSKGIWRDLRVLHEMEPILADRGERAVYFMLGTLAGERRAKDIRQMERVYGWPVAHERGYPDLCGGEEVLGEMFDAFNRDHEHSRAVLVNQWGWNREACGERMVEDMEFLDIRAGTDVEFGLSVYEPFGISQFEGLSFGALCVVSNVCGCMGFARKAMGQGDAHDNIIEGDFLSVPEEMSVDELLNLPTSVRDRVEAEEGRRLARAIVDRLPRSAGITERRIKKGYELAERMSWEHVVSDYFLPALGRAAAKS